MASNIGPFSRTPYRTPEKSKLPNKASEPKPEKPRIPIRYFDLENSGRDLIIFPVVGSVDAPGARGGFFWSGYDDGFSKWAMNTHGSPTTRRVDLLRDVGLQESRYVKLGCHVISNQGGPFVIWSETIYWFHPEATEIVYMAKTQTAQDLSPNTLI